MYLNIQIFVPHCSALLQLKQKIGAIKLHLFLQYQFNIVHPCCAVLIKNPAYTEFHDVCRQIVALIQYKN